MSEAPASADRPEEIDTPEAAPGDGTDGGIDARPPDLGSLEAGEVEGEESPYRGVRVQLAAFDGPLDLLLHLIQRDEIDIYDIPIAHITQQYLEHIDLMRELDLEVCGDYLVMAATLIRIKSQMLLPTPVVDEEGEEIDPREELVRRLVEYRRFKAIAGTLRDLEAERSRRHGRNVMPPELDPEEQPIGRVSVFDLLSYMKEILSRVEEEARHDIELEPVTLEERVEMLRARLLSERAVLFSAFLSDVRSRMAVIVSFMAILEMMKLGEILVTQEDAYHDFLIARRDGGGFEDIA
jgi:segregation and condensation protein A